MRPVNLGMPRSICHGAAVRAPGLHHTALAEGTTPFAQLAGSWHGEARQV